MKFEQSERERIARAFHGRLLEYMAEMDMGNKQLAAHFGMPASTLGVWMRGDALPNVRRLVSISEISGLSCDWWLGLEG